MSLGPEARYSLLYPGGGPDIRSQLWATRASEGTTKAGDEPTKEAGDEPTDPTEPTKEATEESRKQARTVSINNRRLVGSIDQAYSSGF